MASIVSVYYVLYTNIVLLFIFNNVLSIRINMISNAFFMTGDIINTFSNMTCAQCGCTALIADAIGWNCMMNNDTCQLISKYPSSDGHLEVTHTGSFFFQNSSAGLLSSVTTEMSIMTSTIFAPIVGITVAGNSNGYVGSGTTGLNSPHGLFITDNGTLYVADTYNVRVQAFPLGFSSDWTVVSSPILNFAEFLYADANTSTIYVSDHNLHKVIIHPQDLTIPKMNNSVGCDLNKLVSTTGIAVDSKGSVYITSKFCQHVLKWNGPDANTSIRVAGTGLAGNDSTQLSDPYGIALDEINSVLYVADMYNHRIQKVFLNTNSTVGVTVAGGNGAGSALNQLNSPTSVIVSRKDGSLYIADGGNHRIVCWKVNAIEGILIAGSMNGTAGNTAVLLDTPFDLKLDANETFLYVSDMNNNRVQRFQLS
ncbi:hypothetical protein I4U23_023415 [Adineta vaga]|nr:hypothetical protein I4U23_023415 [Adineta vaga]